MVNVNIDKESILPRHTPKSKQETLTYGSKTFCEIAEFKTTVTTSCLLVPSPVRDLNDAAPNDAREVAFHACFFIA